MTETSSTSSQSSSSSDFTLGFLAGAFFGGIMTYLWFVPDGKERLKELLREGSDFASELEKKAIEVGEELTHEVQERTPSEVSEKVSDTTASIKKRFFKKSPKKS